METVVAHHPNIQANAMALDYDGKFSVLGARRHLVLIDLDNPLGVYKRLNRQSKWDISRVSWNPCASSKEYFVATYSQWADLWKWTESTGSLVATLSGHTRVISDVDWSPCDGSLLATCSIDTYIYVWDTRDTKRPKMTPSAVAGASQVKWNKLVPHTLATAHDGDIRIWDIRNGRTPMQYITAHLSKIHSLDWSPVESDTLASSGQDTTVRFWNTSEQSLHASYQISAGAPVWKARYTPFGYGMVTALMPQMHKRDNSILLWNCQDVSSVVHRFGGHKDVILDFGWRYHAEDPMGAELVTWSKDHSLRLWKAGSSILMQCGCGGPPEDELDEEDESYNSLDPAAGDQEAGMQMATGLPVGNEFNVSRLSDRITPRNSAGSYRPQELFLDSPSPRFSTSPAVGGIVLTPQANSATTPPSSLEREFKLMNIDLQNLFIEEVDPYHRVCVATIQSDFHVVKLLIQFPLQYPKNVPPSFQFLKPTNINQNSMIKLLNLLREVAQSHVRRNLSCLESCLRVLSNHVDNMSLKDLCTQDAPPPPYINMTKQVPGYQGIFGTYQHLVNIPFPRTSGARFCGAGQLVTFMRPTHVKGFEASSEPTPRCLAALMSFRNNSFAPKMPLVVAQSGVYATSPTSEKSEISVRSFYYKEKKQRKSWKNHMKDSFGSSQDDKRQMRLHKAAGKVVIQDLSLVLHLNRKLAEAYTVPTKDNYLEACKRNREAAEGLGRSDIVELWKSLELIQSSILQEESSTPSLFQPWASTNFGKEFLCSLIDHYSKLGDVQTLAMISCMFSVAGETKPEKSLQLWSGMNSPICRSASHNSFENDSNGSNRSNSFCENPSDLWWFRAASPGNNMLNYLDSPTDNDYRYMDPPVMEPEITEQESHEKLKQLLDYDKQLQYDSFKQAYADILDRWGLLNRKTEILKYKSQPAPAHTGLVFVISCQHCGSDTQSPQCTSCKRFAISCSLCQEPVKKLISFCSLCGHGGHSEHMESWFKTCTFCATGCGCECRQSAY